MVTVLILILMESDALHQAAQGKVSKRMVEKHPFPESMVILEDDRQEDSEIETPAS
jgi:hypothetical protein